MWTTLLNAALLAAPLADPSNTPSVVPTSPLEGSSIGPGNTASERAETGSAAAETARIFDLRGLDALALSAAERSEGTPFQMFPLMRGVAAEEWPNQDALRPQGEGPSAALLGLFTDNNYKGIVRADFLEPGVVLLVATDETHRRFEALVDLAIEIATDVPVLMVRVLDGDELVSEHRIQLPRNAPVAASTLRSDTVLAGVHSQVAQGVATGDSAIVEALVGFDLLVQGDWEGAGVKLAYAALRTERVEPEAALETTMIVTRTRDGGRVDVDARHVWQERYAVEGAALAGEAVVTRARPLDLMLDGRQVQVSLLNERSSRARAAIAVEDAWVIAPRTATLEASALTLFGPTDLGLLASERRAIDVLLGQGNLRADFTVEATAQLDLIDELLDNIKALPLGFADLFLVGASESQRLAEQLAVLASPVGTPLRVELLQGVHGGTPREPVCAFDALPGSRCAITVGREELLVKNTAIEVAQNASSTEPVVLCQFSGATIHLEMYEIGDGRLGYHASGLLSYLDGADSAPMLDETAGERTVTSARRAVINHRGVFALRDGAYVAELGGSREGPGLGIVVRRVQ